jgi:hypothetical protein
MTVKNSLMKKEMWDGALLWCNSQSLNNRLDVKGNDERALDFAHQQFHLLQSQWVWTFHVQLMLFSLNTFLIFARVSVTLFQRFTQNLMLFHHEISSGQMHDSNVKTKTSTLLLEILYTDFQGMLVSSSNIAVRCYNRYKDDSTSSRNYGYPMYFKQFLWWCLTPRITLFLGFIYRPVF